MVIHFKLANCIPQVRNTSYKLKSKAENDINYVDNGNNKLYKQSHVYIVLTHSHN